MKRIDIKQHDVFISWTSADRKIKDEIVAYLRENEITCLESDHQCSGDFTQWSREAVHACNVFLVIISKATFESKWVPVEIEECKELEDYKNRIVPIFINEAAFKDEKWEIKECESSVILSESGLTDSVLNDVLGKVVSLNINLLGSKYRQATKSDYIKLMSLSQMKKIKDRNFDFSALYINRTLCEMDEEGQKVKQLEKIDELYKSGEIFFIYGPAGCGKTQYINQLKENAPDDFIIINLRCSKIIPEETIIKAAYKEFSRVTGNKYFYSENDFNSLINNRRIMIVFDGLDEMPIIEERRKLISKAEDFYKVNKENVVFLFTGRNSSDADLIDIVGKKPRFFLLEKLNENEIRTLSENLFIGFKKENECDTFFVKVSNLNEEIRSNPLLLSQLAIIYDAKNDIPETIVGIYDAISEITLKLDKNADIKVPDIYKEMVGEKISGILKDFSQERYCLLSKGENIETQKIFARILEKKWDIKDAKSSSEFLVDYLESRAVFVDGEFYHKMFLEYFTAVKYYETAFDDYDKIEDADSIKDLFSHYEDPYWSTVIKLFLIKADNCIDEETTETLYNHIMQYGICEYSILFESCRDLIRFKTEAQKVLVSDVIKKSVDGTYPSYGPLFWYVPEFELYETCLIALESLKYERTFPKILALVRDVCYIMGGKYTAVSVTEKVPVLELFKLAEKSLTGVRRALCELFYLGDTSFSGGTDIYPRCFNVSEVKSFMENGCGIIGRMTTPFSDELEMFYHTSYNEVNNEFIGLVSCPYIIDEIEDVLTKKSCRKLTGLILAPSDNTKMEYIAINRRHIKVVYIPENIIELEVTRTYSKLGLLASSLFDVHPKLSESDWLSNISLSLGVTLFCDSPFYFSSNISLPEGPVVVNKLAFIGCKLLEKVSLPSSVKVIESWAFNDCENLTWVNMPEGIVEIGEGTFAGCFNLTSINIPIGTTVINDYIFKDCYFLEEVKIPNGITRIGESAFEHCWNMNTIDIPDGVVEIGNRAFVGCCKLNSIDIPNSVIKIGDHAFEYCGNLEPKILGARFVDQVERIFGYEDICCEESLEDEVFDTLSESEDSLNVGEKDTTILDYGTNKKKKEAFIKKFCSSEFCGRRNSSNINVPDGVTKIKDSEFAFCKTLLSINVPNSVTLIGKGAFWGCASLTEIEIPSGVTVIGESAFCQCSSLTTINLPNGLRDVGRYAFFECSSLTEIEIPDSVTKIAGHTFAGCESLIRLGVPKSIIEIADAAFRNCRSLKFLDISEGIKKIDNCTVEDSVSLNEFNIPVSVTHIGESAFENCCSLLSLEIPTTVRIIGNNAFSGCNSLYSVKIGRRFEDDIIRIFGDIDRSIITFID